MEPREAFAKNLRAERARACWTQEALGHACVFKNPSSHRQVDFDDPTLASEVILLADLLLRLLDRHA